MDHDIIHQQRRLLLLRRAMTSMYPSTQHRYPGRGMGLYSEGDGPAGCGIDRWIDKTYLYSAYKFKRVTRRWERGAGGGLGILIPFWT